MTREELERLDIVELMYRYADTYGWHINVTLHEQSFIRELIITALVTGNPISQEPPPKYSVI